MDSSSNFNAIIQQIAAVPKGKVSTYGDVAKAAGLPGYARYVGAILKKLPKDTKVPWHRIINSQGRISFPIGSDSFNEQVKRLQAEDIHLIKGKINLKHFRF